MSGPVYIVAGSRPWVREVFERTLRDLPGRWLFVGSRDELTVERLERVAPRAVFFIHWSWIVPESLLERWECIGFHMTDLPYGRGGSPLQNLISRGHRDTVLSAQRMERELDAGPVYLKRPLSLAGTAEAIYLRMSRLAAEMIDEIVRTRPEPQPQSGEVTAFRRRKPAQSEISEVDDLEALHDFIRMLDAEGYPHAFLEHAGFRFEFRRSALYDGRLVADVSIRRIDR